jgi:hypothetical protein
MATPKGPNREALRLYRGKTQMENAPVCITHHHTTSTMTEILRTCNRFYWPSDKGEPWRNVLKKAARKEFEQAREERVSEHLAYTFAESRQAR